jgi:hypothetical protein
MVDEEEESGRGFKVEDRRRFSAEGELKAEYQADEPRSGSAAFVGKDTPSSGGAPFATSGGLSAEPPRADQAHTSVSGSSGADITFAGFIVGLSTQALVQLGEIQDPGFSGDVDLNGAQQLIDIIGMLQQKTRGNLDKHEQDLLESVLFELRVKYVERSRRS